MKKNSAKNCSDCDGCQWQDIGDENGWCYMFEDEPENLPCSQHDKFAVDREIFELIVKKNPIILPMIVESK